MKGNPWILAASAGAFLLILVLLLGEIAPHALDNPERRMNLVYLVLLLAAISGGFLLRLRRAPGTTLAQLGLWIVIIAGLMMLYGYRQEFAAIGRRLQDLAMPTTGRTEGEGAISFAPSEDGHYRLRAEIGGADIVFMVDTGASGVLLSPQDAERLGYDLRQLSFTQIAETANGRVRWAPIVLADFSIGPIRLTDMPAAVNEAPMRESLLGMTFLSRLKSWRMEDGRLILEQ